MQYIIVGVLIAGLIAWRVRRTREAESFYLFSVTSIGWRSRIGIFFGVGDGGAEELEIALEIGAIVAIIAIAVISFVF